MDGNINVYTVAYDDGVDDASVTNMPTNPQGYFSAATQPPLHLAVKAMTSKAGRQKALITFTRQIRNSLLMET